jgi:hypothetical protein
MTAEVTSMQKLSLAREDAARGTTMEQMSQALHDLCQPLTTLQCRLEIAGLVGTEQAYRDAVNLGLAECARLMDGVGSMREIVRAGRQLAEAEEMRAAR